jgi:hypothetical protein
MSGLGGGLLVVVVSILCGWLVGVRHREKKIRSTTRTSLSYLPRSSSYQGHRPSRKVNCDESPEKVRSIMPRPFHEQLAST